MTDNDREFAARRAVLAALQSQCRGLPPQREYACPVCEHGGFDENPLDRTFDICPQCSVEFGYDDVITPHAVLRERWIAAGRPYWRTLDAAGRVRYDLMLHPATPPSPFVPHCGYCGRPLPCACGTTPAKDAPTMLEPAEEYIAERYGVKYCTRCGFPAAACRGHEG